MTDPVVNGPDTTAGSAEAAPVARRTTTRSDREPGEAASAALTAPAGPADTVAVPAARRAAEPAVDGAGNAKPIGTATSGDAASDESGGGGADGAGDNKSRRRRGSRGGRNRNRSAGAEGGEPGEGDTDAGAAGETDPEAAGAGATRRRAGTRPKSGRAPAEETVTDGALAPPDELPDRPGQGKIRSAEAAARALVRKPQIGDTRPAPAATEGDGDGDATESADGENRNRSGGRRRRGGRGRGEGGGDRNARRSGGASGRRGGRSATAPVPVEATLPDEPLELDESDLKKRRGRERKGRPVGRYLMCVSVSPKATQMAVLEGRNLIEHYVSRPSDDIAQIHGNIYLGRVQNVLPGMEAAFIDIGTPKNAVLYRGDVQYDPEDVEEKGQAARIEEILKPKQTILCQVTKNPIAHKGARLTQEVSLPGRFVVLIPNSTTYGISKRLADDERKRLRTILDRVRPKGHGLIVRTAADGVTAEEIERDVLSLQERWQRIEALAKKASSPALLYREPDMAVRVIREELNQNYRGIVIDDRDLYEEVRSYVNAISPALVDRVQLYDREVEPISIFERHHVHEQLHRALDKKVWLPSGGSLIIEHTEALTVIDVNTGKNVGSSSLEETVFKNNVEAAEEIAKQLRLRDIGGIIVIDFIDMEIEQNRRAVMKAFREALARDKTRTQVFDISELGLVEMTRKRIGEGLLESFATRCPECEGRGLKIDDDLLR
jgi:ribonuclease E